MTRYRVENLEIEEGNPSLQDRLKRAYANKARPLCLCRDPAPEMYIAKFEDRFLIKRMPGSGDKHSPDCDSYEPPPELSGLGQVMGSAIQEDVTEGVTNLKLNFSLKKLPGRQAPVPKETERESVKTDGSKLTLRGLLHYLWDEAGLNRWAPAMEGKRSWFVVRKYLQQAAESKVAKGASLAEMLYIPETFNAERKFEIEARRMGKMLPYVANHSAARKLMLVVGEVKEITTSRYGYKVILKHLPNYHFMMNEDLYKRLTKSFAAQLGMKERHENSHLMLIGTFGIGHTEVATLEEVTLMNVSEHWIPFENTSEKTLIDLMTEKQRRFTKSLRYNLPSNKPLAAMVAADTHPDPTAMFIHNDGDDAFNQAFEEMISQCEMPQWIWHISKGEMPTLPVTGAVK